MEENQNYQPRLRKVFDFGLTAVGLALFIILGAKAAEQVDDRGVAAGSAPRSSAVAAAKAPLLNMSNVQNLLNTVSENSEKKTAPKSLESTQSPARQADLKQEAKIPEHAAAHDTAADTAGQPAAKVK